jgi:hypothetical protein
MDVAPSETCVTNLRRTPMLTDLQKRKISNLFAVHDLDHDGVAAAIPTHGATGRSDPWKG